MIVSGRYSAPTAPVSPRTASMNRDTVIGLET
jgi:hypothetical protein